MSSNTNQTSPTANQEAMATLAPLLYKNMTGGGKSDNPPETGTDLGQCKKWGERGKRESQCTRPATVRPYTGKREHLVYCAECWAVKKEENKKSCKNRRVSKKAKVKHEKQQILEVVDEEKLSGLSLMAKQFQVVVLRLPFMSQLVSVRNAFHSKLKTVRTDEAWTHMKKLKPNDAASASRATAARRKTICHYRTFGARRDWQREIEGLLSAQTVFLLKTLFKEVKNILPTEDIFNIETLRLVVTETPDWEVPHFAKHKDVKAEIRWGWTFHLSLCEEGAHLFLWEGEKRTIQKVHIPFGCALLTRSDVCHAGLGNSPGNMMFQGNLFALPMYNSNRDCPEYTMDPGAWARMTAGNDIKTQEKTLIKDETLANQVAGTATQLRSYYTFSTDFLDCMKTK